MSEREWKVGDEVVLVGTIQELADEKRCSFPACIHLRAGGTLWCSFNDLLPVPSPGPPRQQEGSGEPPATWCCEGSSSGGHAKTCRYHESNFAPTSPAPAAQPHRATHCEKISEEQAEAAIAASRKQFERVKDKLQGRCCDNGYFGQQHDCQKQQPVAAQPIIEAMTEEIVFLKGELKALETKEGIQNVFEQGRSIGRAEAAQPKRVETPAPKKWDRDKFEAWWNEWSLSEDCDIDENLNIGQQAYLVSVCKRAFAAGQQSAQPRVTAELEKIVARAKTKTPCASHYECLLADLMGLLRQSASGEKP